jgi:hypothetical protein
MGLMDTLGGVASSLFAQPDTSGGFRSAQGTFRPYTEAGERGLAGMEDYLGQQKKTLSRYGEPADWMYRQIGATPQEYYQTLMGGYETSPQYQQQLEAMERAIANAAAASGMTGSGSFYDTWQRGARDILAADQQQWLENMLRSTQQQQSYLGDFRGQQAQYLQAMQNMAQMGLGAAQGMSQAQIGEAQAKAASDPLAGLIGAGISALGFL